MDVTEKATSRQCAIHPRKFHTHVHPPNLQRQSQEVQTHEDQNTGKKNVEIVDMIKSMGLCEEHAKNQMNHHGNLHEVSIQHESLITECIGLVFNALVHAQSLSLVWENCHQMNIVFKQLQN